MLFSIAMSAFLKFLGRFETSKMSAKFGYLRKKSLSSAPYFAPGFVEIGVFKGVSAEDSIPFVSILSDLMLSASGRQHNSQR